MRKTAVVILNWNGRELMRKYLPQVIANTQSDLGVDVIVADNAADRRSLEMLATDFPDVQVIKLDRNYGFAEGYNRVLAQLGHEYVVLLNSDVAPAAGWLEPLVSLMESDAALGLAPPN